MDQIYNTDLESLKFDYLKGTRFQSVYETLNDAKKLYEIDKGACCTKLRYALEIIIDEILLICDYKSEKRNSINSNLNLIKRLVPDILRQFNNEDIVDEMHNVRINGNYGTHYDNKSEINLNKATHTSWIAMKKICKWISTFESKYREYKADENTRLKRKAEENRKKVNGIISTIFKLVLFIIGIIIAILTGKRINKL